MDSLLIVDDEKGNIDALHRLLRNDYEIKSTTSPFDALKLIQAEEFTVIVSDQRMPKMTGVDLLEKAKHVSPNSTRILLTGYTDMDAVIEAINRGHIYRYIAKPWEPDELKAVLRQACEANHLRVELSEKNRALEDSNEELRAALDQLRVLDRAKARFLSLISHELNTPLTVLNAFIPLLEEQVDSIPGDLKKAVSSLGAASDRLTVIVQDVLTYVKIEANPEYQSQEVDLTKITQKIIAGFGKNKIGSFQFQGPSKAIIQGDPEKLRIALGCLLADVASRSFEGEGVRVKLEEADASWVYSVFVKGEPLSEEALKPLETGASEMHHTQRLGMSLAICRIVIEAHQGTMQIVPAGEQGNLIRISLPE